MTTRHSPRGGRSVSGILACLSLIASAPLASAAATASDIPTGSLTVDRNLVRVGGRTQLGWNIQYPSGGVTEVVDIDNNGTIVPKKKLQMRVRVLGAAFQSGSTLLPVDAYWSLNGSSWSRFFYGTSLVVNPNSVLIDQQVKKNDRIDFGAQGWGGSSWLPFHQTGKTDKYVIVLQNGDRAPSYAPAYNQGSVTSFLKPYIDSTGRIKIGSRDLIILWECSTSAPGTTYFDMQDLVVLTTFE